MERPRACIVNIPILLERRADLYNKFIELSTKHLNKVHNDIIEFIIRDVSGLSNPVYIVSVKDCTDFNNQIVIRFFES